MVEIYKPIEIDDPKNLPEYYMMFTDNLDGAVNRLGKKAEKLFERGYRIPQPLLIFRYTQSKNRKPYTMLAIKLEKK